jgi:hypothetical protein
MAAFLCLFQVISCLISILVYTVALVSYWRNDGISFLSFLVPVIVVGYVGFVLKTNLQYLLNKNPYRKAFKVNQLFCILQLFHLSIFGAVFYFTAGPEITAAFFYSSEFLWQVRAHFCNIRLNLSYHSGDDAINAGINVVPLLFLLFSSRHKLFNHSPS